MPAAFAAVNAYKSRDPSARILWSKDGRLYHLEMINNEWVRQLYVPLELRGRLVVAKHGSAAGGHRAAVETLAKLRKLYYIGPQFRRMGMLGSRVAAVHARREREQSGLGSYRA